MSAPRLPVANPADALELPAEQDCLGGQPCILCVRLVANHPHTLHRCRQADCICHDGWRLDAEDWDAQVRCGRKHLP